MCLWDWASQTNNWNDRNAARNFLNSPYFVFRSTMLFSPIRFFFVLLFCFLQNRSVINLRAEIERLLISKVVQIAKFKNLDLETLVTTVTDFQAIDFFMMTRSQRPFKKLLENLYSKCFPISYWPRENVKKNLKQKEKKQGITAKFLVLKKTVVISSSFGAQRLRFQRQITPMTSRNTWRALSQSDRLFLRAPETAPRKRQKNSIMPCLIINRMHRPIANLHDMQMRFNLQFHSTTER